MNNLKYYSSKEIDWVKPSDIGHGKYLKESKDKLSQIAVDENKATIYKPDTLLIICIGGGVGRVALTNKTISSNQQITGILFNQEVLPEYAYYYFFCREHLFKENASQTTLPIINQKGLKDLEFKCPDKKTQNSFIDYLHYCEECFSNSCLPLRRDFNLPEQLFDISKKIFFSYYTQTNIISELLNQQTHLQQLRQAILQEAVQGKLSEPGFAGLKDDKMKGSKKILPSSNLKNHSSDNEPAATLLQRIKAEKQKLIAASKLKKEKELPPITKDEIPFELPKGWVWCRIVEIADIGTGGTPLTSTTEYYNGNIPWITSSATGSLFVSDAEKFITVKAVKETNCKVYPIGTLIVAMYGQGKTRGQVTELLIEAATNQACASIELIIKDKHHKEYVKYFFQKIYLEIRELAAGGAQPNLNLQKIKETIIPLPPLFEQHRIITKVQQLLQMVNQLEQQVAHSQTQAQQLLQAVLKEAFTKKVRLYEESELLTLAAEE